jgi:uncharacterized membrane protein
MTALTVWRFDSPYGARNALDLLERLREEDLLQLDDAAIVTWPEDRKKPKTEQLRSMARIGVLGGSFWGLLFGLLFSVPLLGIAAGVAIGAASTTFLDFGIDDGFLRDVRDEVRPGTSALFLMTSNVVQDKVFDQFRSTGAQLVSTSLSQEQEQRLRDVFGEERELG